MKTIIKSVACGVALACFASCSSNQTGAENAGSTTGNVEEINEERFEGKAEDAAEHIVELHVANTAELQASQEALTKASSADVKKLAGMLVEAHTKMGKEMSSLAMQKQVTLPSGLEDEEMRELSRLSEKTGIDYDREYLDLMKNKHDEAERKLEKLANDAQDAEVKQFASKSVAEIRAHKEMIESTQKNVKEMKRDARNDGDNKMKSKNTDAHDGKSDDLSK